MMRSRGPGCGYTVTEMIQRDRDWPIDMTRTCSRTRLQSYIQGDASTKGSGKARRICQCLMEGLLSGGCNSLAFHISKPTCYLQEQLPQAHDHLLVSLDFSVSHKLRLLASLTRIRGRYVCEQTTDGLATSVVTNMLRPLLSLNLARNPNRWL
jgi:hypothetical protein